jgi:outer membrane protein TolC
VEAAEAVIDRRRAETVFAADRVRPALDAVLSYDRFGLAGSENPLGMVVPGLPSQIPAGLEGELGRSFGTLRDGDFDDARAALVFGIPIGNRSAKAAATAARNTERQAEADLARVRKAIRAEVLDAAAALQTAGQRIEAARSAREAAEVQLAAERERYGVGMSTNFLVLTRQNDLARARLDEIAALTDYRTARVEMARATGSLLEERGIEVQTDSSGGLEP